MDFQVGQRWWWKTPRNDGQRLVVELIRTDPYPLAKILQIFKPDPSFKLGSVFAVIVRDQWEYLPGQDSPSGS